MQLPNQNDTEKPSKFKIDGDLGPHGGSDCSPGLTLLNAIPAELVFQPWIRVTGTA